MSQSDRRLVHTRSIRGYAYARADKLWDLVACLQDVKQKDLSLEDGMRPAGTPYHDMELTVTIDATMQILDVQARTLASPYAGVCDSFPEVYRKLIGLNLMRGFREQVRDRVGGIQGCTHLTELALVLPTLAIQAFAGELHAIGRESDSKPLQLDRCRALRADGAFVATHYPRWYRGKGDTK